MVVCCMENFYYALIIICFFSLLYLSWQDIKSQEISRNITLGIVFLALLFNLVALLFYENEQAYQSLLGGLFLGSGFLLCMIITKEKALGMGDVYLFLLMGLLVGLGNIILSLAITIFSALVYSVFKFKKLNLKQKIPFVPFITLGIFSTIIIVSFLL